MISELKRKSLPAIARAVGLKDAQPLHHFLTESPWRGAALREQRLLLLLKVLKGREILLIIDETGDAKKGRSTDYVKRQYIGNLGKVENGIVAVSAYGVIDNMTFPLTFRLYKPKERLKAGEVYQTKPQIAAQMIRELKAQGFKFQLVLADSLYGESSSNFLSVLEELKLEYVVAIRSNHGVWLPQGARVRTNHWRRFQRRFADGTSETRYIREIIFGKRGQRRYWQITTDPETLPANSTWDVMTRVAGIDYKEVGNLYGMRNWVEYGLKQSKNELGWADFRVTDATQIEKWWEVVCCAYVMVTLHAAVLKSDDTDWGGIAQQVLEDKFAEHDWWDEGQGWKNILNNLRLIVQPFLFWNLIKPWLKLFPIPQLERGFDRLRKIMNLFRGRLPLSGSTSQSFFSSA